MVGACTVCRLKRGLGKEGVVFFRGFDTPMHTMKAIVEKLLVPEKL